MIMFHTHIIGGIYIYINQVRGLAVLCRLVENRDVG